MLTYAGRFHNKSLGLKIVVQPGQLGATGTAPHTVILDKGGIARGLRESKYQNPAPVTSEHSLRRSIAQKPG